MNDILSSLGLCKRAGKLAAGFDAVCDAVSKNPNDTTIFLTSDISDKTKKEILFHANKYGTKTVLTHIKSTEINKLLHKNFAVLAVTDIKMAKMLENKNI